MLEQEKIRLNKLALTKKQKTSIDCSDQQAFETGLRNCKKRNAL